MPRRSAPVLRPVRFAFDELQYDGFTYGQTWNGFPVIHVTPATARVILGDMAIRPFRDAISRYTEDGDEWTDLTAGGYPEAESFLSTEWLSDLPSLMACIIDAEKRGAELVTLDGFTPTLV